MVATHNNPRGADGRYYSPHFDPEVIDLLASPPPGMPRYMRSTTILNAKVPTPLGVRAREHCRRLDTSINAWLRTLIERELDHTTPLPPDVNDWLEKQAAQCGVPGQPQQALILVVRHLAARWPDGGRLHNETVET